MVYLLSDIDSILKAKNLFKIEINKLDEVKNHSLIISLYKENDYMIVSSDEFLIEPFIKIDSISDEAKNLIDEELDLKRIEKIREINTQCDNSLQNFTSSALGEPYIYDLKQEDQINLMGLIIAGVDSPFRCAKLSNTKDKQNIPHTLEQLKEVYKNGLEYKSKVLLKAGELKEKVKNAKLKEEIININIEF